MNRLFSGGMRYEQGKSGMSAWGPNYAKVTVQRSVKKKTLFAVC